VPVITEAPESLEVQRRRRQVRYATLMGLRVVCLILATVLVSLHVPYALAWVLLLTVGMVAFPWMAVIIANDRLPKNRSRLTTVLRRRPAAPALGGVSSPSEADDDAEAGGTPALPRGRVVDH
jgi:hypothetical protein